MEVADTTLDIPVQRDSWPLIRLIVVYGYNVSMPSFLIMWPLFTENWSLAIEAKDIIAAVFMTSIATVVWGSSALVILLLFAINPPNSKVFWGKEIAIWFIQYYASNLGFMVHLGTLMYALIRFLFLTDKYDLEQNGYNIYFVYAYGSFATVFEYLQWSHSIDAIKYLDPEWNDLDGNYLIPYFFDF